MTFTIYSMRIRIVVTILALTLSLQTALAAVCSAGCATMTAGSSHHGSNAPMPAAEVSGDVEHHDHHDAGASEQMQAAPELPAFSETARTGGITAVSTTTAKCPLPDSTQQRQRTFSDLTFGAMLPASVLPSETKFFVYRAAAAIPPDLSPPPGFTVLRI